MKTTEEKDQAKPVGKKPVKRVQHKSEELKTDSPLSEKDEVKKLSKEHRKTVEIILSFKP